MNLRDLPPVDALSRDPRLAEFPERIRIEAARSAVASMRECVLRGEAPGEGPDLALREAERLSQVSLRRVVNLSGVVLHTGLGRARLARTAAERAALAGADHAALEFDLEDGTRGDRRLHVRDLLQDLTGAEDALVVNNAAAGVLLTLTALASGREVILSRGQMIEIGGSFRMPDIVRQSGCRLVEVGCTNKTRLSDYERGITPDTAAILRCHPSNYRIVGFTEEPTGVDLAQLARRHEVTVIDDQGNGCLVDLAEFGLPHETTLAEAVAEGADVVVASGDKLLGGPQAGLILGRGAAIDEIRRHPLARAVRIDKLCLAALEETLRLYREGRQAEIPTLEYLARRPADLERTARRLVEASALEAEVEPGLTEVGGGASPGVGLPTWRVGLRHRDLGGLARRLRTGEPPIVGRIEADRLWLDPRTLAEDEIEPVERALRELR
jgi:L-seryl-tRNA(Ser) seleniumtransferase